MSTLLQGLPALKIPVQAKLDSPWLGHAAGAGADGGSDSIEAKTTGMAVETVEVVPKAGSDRRVMKEPGGFSLTAP